MDQRISMITLGVKDLDKSIDFYTKLGFETEGKEGDIVFFQLNGTWLSLYPLEKLAEDANVERDMQGNFAGFTLAHIVRSKDEVCELMKHAEEIGALVTDPSHDREWGGYSGYFRDPDGYLWEVAWNPHFPLADDN